jgi:hypothetical protein
MDQQFFEDEFEQFLRENADQHRMYPSDGVWTNIYRQLHSGRRRIALGGMLLLVMSGIFWLANTGSDIPIHPAITANNSLQLSGSGATISASTVTVDDIIEKLRAKSLIPTTAIAAPLSLSPLQLHKPDHLSDTYNPAKNQVSFPYSSIGMTIEGSPTRTTKVFQAVEGQTHDAIADLRASAVSKIDITEPGQARVSEPVRRSPLLSIAAATEANSHFASSISITGPKPKIKNRVSYLMSFAPSIGYRNLFEGNNHYTYGSSPLMVRHLDVNRFVDHQPAIGFELGGGIRYQVTRSLAVRTGLQINLTRYSIAAFAHSPEKATLSLNPDFGYLRDTLVATSNVRNLAGNSPEQLQNEFLQIALPVAAEMKLFGDNKLQVNLAGSIQPVYLLNTNQYLLSSDYSNYIKEPSLIRRWNMATSMEIFVSYTTGNVRWQVGPQFRYNLLSTYKTQYPIRENLMEYGFKFGVSKTIR